MDEADRILINSLISIGLELPDVNMGFEDFSPDILINATSLCLELIYESKNQPQSFPKSCPANMASRYKVGQTLSEAIKSLGYKDAVGYQSFLYPNVKDSRRIVSFLIEILPKETGPSLVEGLNEISKIKIVIKNAFSDNWKSAWLPYYCRKDRSFRKGWSTKCVLVPFQSDRKKLYRLSDWLDSFPPIRSQVADVEELLVLAANYESKSRVADSVDREKLDRMIRQINVRSAESAGPGTGGVPEAKKRTKFMAKSEGRPGMGKKANEEDGNADKRQEQEEESTEELERQYGEWQAAYETAVDGYNGLVDKLDRLNEKCSSLVHAESELEAELESCSKEVAVAQKAAIVLLHGEDSLDKLEAAISKRQTQIGTMGRQWDEHKTDLARKIAEVRLERAAKSSRTRELELHLGDVKEEMEACRRNYQDKDAEIRLLDDKVKTVIKSSAPKQNRAEFTKRILELTENKKKQNAEIKKILGEIFALQKEINMFRGKLERSFKETSECIFEYARKDEMSKKMYKVLLGIHENCSNLVTVIEEKGKLLREIRELETSIENEDRDNIEKNLEKIIADFAEAKDSCANLKKRLKAHKSNHSA